MTDLPASLLTKSEESLAAARALLDAGHPAFAASRAYYAMFYACDAALAARGLRFRRHGAVHAAFGERLVKTGEVPREFHRWLLEAFAIRSAADYELGPEITAEDAALLIERAERVRAGIAAVM